MARTTLHNKRCYLAGEGEALVSEPVPADACGELSADASHTVVLPAHVGLDGCFPAPSGGAPDERNLTFEVQPLFIPRVYKWHGPLK